MVLQFSLVVLVEIAGCGENEEGRYEKAANVIRSDVDDQLYYDADELCSNKQKTTKIKRKKKRKINQTKDTVSLINTVLTKVSGGWLLL